jgi:succinylarginine dihydrolase
VIAVGNQNVLFYHEQAFYQSSHAIAEIQQKFIGDDLHFISVKTNEVSVQDAIKSYLFNTQIITLANGEMAIIAPTNCKENPAVFAYLESLLEQNTPIKHVYYHDVKESMRNGGGPACLRLRVAMTEKEYAAVNQSTLINDKQFERLNTWVDKHYRDTLHVSDLSDPQLLIESRTALDELTQLLQLGSVYPFQQV